MLANLARWSRRPADRRAFARPWSPLAVAVVLALAGCAGPGGGGEQTAESATDIGPLGEFLGYGEDSQQDYADQSRRVEELVVACMAEQGFEYLPVEYPEFTEDPAFAAREDLSPLEYASEYGYGFNTTQTTQEAEQEFTDPNSELVEALAPAEQEAYYLALYGEQTEFDPEAEEEVVEYGFGGGCQGEAAEEVYGGGGAQEELGPAYEQLYERIQADPRMVEANAAWSACMSEAGYSYTNQEEIYEYLSEQQNALYEESYAELPTEVPAEGATEEFVEPELDEARLAELREEEIATAVADETCRAEHLPPELVQEVNAEYEEAFIEENRELLEQVRDSGAAG